MGFKVAKLPRFANASVKMLVVRSGFIRLLLNNETGGGGGGGSAYCKAKVLVKTNGKSLF